MKSKLYPFLVVVALVLLCYGTYLGMGQGPAQATDSLTRIAASPQQVVLELESSAIFKVGDTAIIDSAESGLREKEKVVAIPDARHITVAKLDFAHGALDAYPVVDRMPFSQQLKSPAPTEASMGNAQRIFYYHVPAATCAYTLFFVNFVASIVFLWKRSPVADLWAVAAAEVGLVFATVVLVTGPIWGRIAWNTWWSWEPRLTTFLILWLLYVSYLVVRRSAEGTSGGVISAAVAIMAFLDVPFSYIANRFRGHHPPPITLEDPGMKFALLVNMLAFLFFAGLIIWLRGDLEKLARNINTTHIQKAARRTTACIILPAAFLFQERQNLDPTKFMLAGYISAWVIYLAYLVFLMSKLSKLKKEAAELGM
ncbi:MAG TPA: cytochrome c biogenesis protein CcsA [Verrucomicrobiae bacterium]|jgi:heme exporter protein C|nr:cytochrome c biogenesis protein CcsA [Verrucomicrobiae bacterium]